MITAPTAEGQISQIKSYLIQLTDQLEFSLNDIAKAPAVTAPAETPTSTERAVADPDLESRFVAFRSQVIGGSIADTMTLGKRLTGADGAEIDLDNLKTPGCYYSPDGKYIESGPAGGGFRLEVKLAEDDKKILQTAYYGEMQTTRYFDGNEWSPWLQTSLGADFVSETGKSDGWNYRKWSSGTYEMYGVFEVTPTSSKLNGTLYRTNDIQITTPFAITADAVVTGMGSGDFWLTNGVYANENAISIRIMCDKDIGTADAITVRLHVIGSYAQGG